MRKALRWLTRHRLSYFDLFAFTLAVMVGGWWGLLVLAVGLCLSRILETVAHA